jgi:hypothetical protein
MKSTVCSMIDNSIPRLQRLVGSESRIAAWQLAGDPECVSAIGPIIFGAISGAFSAPQFVGKQAIKVTNPRQ